MKLRIHADSIRLRLKQSEVQSLVEGREVCETCPTAPVSLTYVLRPDSSAETLVSHADGRRLTLAIPAAWLENWDKDERVGFEAENHGIRLIVEKDFKCLHPANPRENEDCYENPEAEA